MPNRSSVHVFAITLITQQSCTDRFFKFLRCRSYGGHPLCHASSTHTLKFVTVASQKIKVSHQTSKPRSLITSGSVEHEQQRFVHAGEDTHCKAKLVHAENIRRAHGPQLVQNIRVSHAVTMGCIYYMAINTHEATMHAHTFTHTK
eukprot:12411973-Karenia_brevis.AAC.1